MICVALADDHRMVRAAMRSFIEEEPGMCWAGDFSSAEAAICFLAIHHVDVLVLDLTLPGMSGLLAIPRIREVAPHVRIVVLSAFGAAERAEEVLVAGACCYLQKPVAPSQLAAVIREAALG